MFKLPLTCVVGYKSSGVEKWPEPLDLSCPFCGRQVTFSGLGWADASQYGLSYARSRCPACTQIAKLFWIKKNPAELQGNEEQHELFIYPIPRYNRTPLEVGLASPQFTPGLLRAYAAATSAYNLKQWSAAAVLCGRVLEGILKSPLPEDRQDLPLAQQLREFPDHLNLQRPILTLTDAIRLGRNIGAHFDEEREPDEATTEMMLDMLDYLIEYLYILPARIEKLREKVGRSD